MHDFPARKSAKYSASWTPCTAVDFCSSHLEPSKFTYLIKSPVFQFLSKFINLKTMKNNLHLTFAPTEAEQDAIRNLLLEYNDKVGGLSGYQSFAITIQDDEGTPVGGISGKISYDWLFIDLLFVPEGLRRSGLGSRLLERAESFAQERNCVGVWLDTHEF